MQKKQNILALHKDKALSFMQEFCAVSGGGIAITMGLDKATSVRPLPFGELQAFMNGTTSALLFYGGTAILLPFMFNWADAMSQKIPFSINAYFPTHNHGPSRIAGIAAGALMSLSVAMNTASVVNPSTRLEVADISDQASFAATVSAYRLRSKVENAISSFVL